MEEPDFGKGVAQLLSLTREKGSLSAAYKSMGMAASKAWKILNRAEADLGVNSVITFTARNPEDKFDFRVKVYSNGSTSIDVNMQNRQSISFQGELDVKEE